MEKIKDFLKCVLLFTICVYLIAGAFGVLNIFQITEIKKETARLEREAAAYHTENERLRLETNKLKQECEQARLKAYIKAFNNGTYPLIENNE